MGIFKKAYQEVFTLCYARRCLLYDYQVSTCDNVIGGDLTPSGSLYGGGVAIAAFG
jgi:hypothetical protein